MFLELSPTLQLFIYCNFLSLIISLLAPINVYAAQMPQQNVATMNVSGSPGTFTDSNAQPLPQKILWTPTTPPPPLPPGTDIGALMASMPIMPTPESMSAGMQQTQQEAAPMPMQAINPQLAVPENGAIGINQMMMNDPNLVAPNTATQEPTANPEAVQVHPSAYFSFSASSFCQRFFLNKEGWPPFINITAHGGAEIEKTITLPPRYHLFAHAITLSLNFGLTADPASFATNNPITGGAFLNIQCMKEDGWPMYNFQIGNASDAHDQVVESASSMMPANSLSSLPFFCTQGCPTYSYLLGGSGSANKLVVTIRPQLANLWPPLGKLSLKTSGSYAISSRNYGSHPLSTMANPRYCGPNANPSLAGWNIATLREAATRLPNYQPVTEDQEKLSGVNTENKQFTRHYLHDLSSTDTKHIFSFGISLQYPFSDSVSLTGDFGFVKSEAVPDMPHSETRYIDDEALEPPFRFCAPGTESELPFKNILTKIEARNAFGYRCGIRLNTPVAQLALSCLNNRKSLLNICVDGDSGKSFEACVIFPLPNNIKLGVSGTYIFRNLKCRDPNTFALEENSTRFHTIAVSVNISGQINLLSITLSFDYVSTWQTIQKSIQESISGEGKTIASTWPENTWPAIPNDHEGFGFTLSIQVPLS